MTSICLDTGEGDPLCAFLQQAVVIDTQGPLLYIGTLVAVHERHLVLAEADVHHASDSRTTRELYVAETRDLGVRVNRGRVVVERGVVASVSLLGEVRG